MATNSVNEPNALVGIPGCFWRVNDHEGKCVARATLRTDIGWNVERRGDFAARIEPMRFADEAAALAALTPDAALVALRSMGTSS